MPVMQKASGIGNCPLLPIRMLLLYISSLFVILSEKFTQSVQCFYQHFCLILIQLCDHRFCHLPVKLRMMMICHTSLICKLDKYHTPVLLTSLSLHIAFFTRLFIDVVREPTVILSLAAMEDMFPPSKTYSLDNVHIIVGNIFIFICDDGFLLQSEDLIEQIHQHVIYNFPIVHSTRSCFSGAKRLLRFSVYEAIVT